MTKQNPLNVRVGDRVAIVFTTREDNSEIEATVTKIDRRADSDGIYFIPHNNLEHEALYYGNKRNKTLGVNEPHFCDIGYVTRIIERAPFTNVYVKPKHSRCRMTHKIDMSQHYYTKTTFMVGALYYLVADLLILADKYPEFGLDEKKCHTYWNDMGCPGLIRKDKYWSIVRKKTFIKWLNRSAKYLARSQSDAFAEEIANNKRLEKEYFDEVENGLWDKIM